MNLSSRLMPGIPLVESPLFSASLEQSDLAPQERDIARALHDRGYAVIDFPDPAIEQRIARIQSRLAYRFGTDPVDPTRIVSGGESRMQDAWRSDPDVQAIAANEAVLSLLSGLYGRRAIPFQTLNFPVGTQQHLHSDSVHFSSAPERFMCGVWLAMEDVHPDAGPLTYVPGSHRWPLLGNGLIGRTGYGTRLPSAQAPFEDAWRAMVDASGARPEMFHARKGQALIWCANLLHGGSARRDLSRTRWSQVTHYYFENCCYLTPAYSDEMIGKLALRSIVDISTGKAVPNLYNHAPVAMPKRPRLHRLRSQLGRWLMR